MEKNTRILLNTLLQASSPSGNEEQVIHMFYNFVSSFVDKCWIDVCGNCIAHKKGPGPKVLIMAHADEVGLMVNYIDENGFLYFKEIGGIDTNILPGLRVRIEGISGYIIGIIGRRPIHLQGNKDSAIELNPEDLWIDISAKDKKEAETIVQVGAYVTFLTEPLEMMDSRLIAKSLDDRIGLAVLLEVAQKLENVRADVFLVASVQEELGSRGAQPVLEQFMPDVGIAVDVTHATDYPTMSPIKDGAIALGKGVAIGIGPNMHKELSVKFRGLATDKGIPFQMEAFPRPTGTDARIIQISGSGVKTGLLSIPCRYMHTPNEVVSLDDADAAVRLIVEYLKTYNN